MGMTATSAWHESGSILIESERALEGTGSLRVEEILRRDVKLACTEAGLVFEELTPVQRLFLTHYRCPTCKLTPLYFVNVIHPTRVRCGKCGNLISFRNGSKYGKMRKKIAYMLRGERP